MKNFKFKTKDKTEEHSKIAKDYAKEIAKHKGVIGQMKKHKDRKKSLSKWNQGQVKKYILLNSLSLENFLKLF